MTENLGLEGKKFGNLRSKIEFQIQQLTTNYENMSYLLQNPKSYDKIANFFTQKIDKLSIPYILSNTNRETEIL